MLMARCAKYRKPVEALSKSDLETIHSTSIMILEEVGIKVDHLGLLDLFRKQGCVVDESRKTVRVREDIVNDSLRTVPHTFNLYSRRPDELKIGSSDFHFVSANDNPFIIDGETFQRRPGRLSDVSEVAKLVDGLEFCHICAVPVLAYDVDTHCRFIYSAAEVVKNTEKTCYHDPTNGAEARDYIELGAAIAGSEDELSRKPTIYACIATSSPLAFPKDTCDVIWEFASRKLPFNAISAPIVGVNCPVTMAGAVSLANAENLAFAVLTQLISEGAPLAFGSATVGFDMRYGTCAYGGIEYGMFGIAAAQLARFYGLPSYGAGGGTNANLSDAQSGYEKMSSSMLNYLAGRDMMCDAGLNHNGLTSLDNIVIQNEIMGMLARTGNGFETNDVTLAFDTIRSVGIGGDFLSAKHTRDNFKTDFTYSDLSSRESYETWSSKGGMDVHRKALMKAQKTIKNSHPAPLSEDVDGKISRLLRKARKGSS